MAKKKSSIFSTIIKIFIFMTIMDALFSSILWDIPYYMFGVAEWLVGLVIGGVVLIGLIILVMALFSGQKDNEKAKRYASVSVNDFLASLGQQAKEDNRLQIDDETFLFFTDRENITLDNVDVYMRNEYVGSLSEYDSAFPNAFNNFMGSMMDKMSKQAKKKASKKKKKEEKPTIVETIEQIKPQEKDCAYYIDRFRQLDSEIENEQVKGHIRSTIEYLEQIKKVEDEFGESKDKTKKLYQYYLPMYVDILANYDRLHDNAPASEEFKENEAKLMKTSAMINSAMQTLASSLVERYYTDLNVDMKTLESILKKDGLVRDIDSTKEASGNE